MPAIRRPKTYPCLHRHVVDHASYPCCGCHGLSRTVSPRPCCCPGMSPPLAHEVAMRVSSRGILTWCVVCGVHEAASVGVGVGQPSPSCSVVRPFVVALPTVWSFVRPGAAPCAYSCSAHVRPCAQGRCGRCPLGSGVMSFSVNYFFSILRWAPAAIQSRLYALH